MCNSKDYRYKVYICGMGNEYNRLSSYLKLYRDRLNVLGIVTTEKQVISEMDGYPCKTIQEIDAGEMDYVIIAVNQWRQIADTLVQYGIEESRIIRGSAFYNPNFDLDKYLRLKNSNISILSNFCLGGGVV